MQFHYKIHNMKLAVWIHTRHSCWFIINKVLPWTVYILTMEDWLSLQAHSLAVQSWGKAAVVVKTLIISEAQDSSRSQHTVNSVAQRIRLSRVVHYIRRTKDMNILENIKATWFLARINLRKGRRNLLQISYNSNKITLLHSCEWQGTKTDSLRVNMTHLSRDRICRVIFCMAIMMALLTWYWDMTSNN
jgi:hypothetical protein